MGFSPCEFDSERTFFVTAVTWQRVSLLQSERMAELLCETMFRYSKQGRYLLHEFILMPDHVHLLLTPVRNIALERAMQFIKGGFSHEAGKLLNSRKCIWEKSFTNHRIRNLDDYESHRRYIHLNPVRKFLCSTPEKYSFSSANPRFQLDALPQGLKPLLLAARSHG